MGAPNILNVRRNIILKYGLLKLSSSLQWKLGQEVIEV